jgi:hypothetical protein
MRTMVPLLPRLSRGLAVFACILFSKKRKKLKSKTHKKVVILSRCDPVWFAAWRVLVRVRGWARGRNYIFSLDAQPINGAARFLFRSDRTISCSSFFVSFRPDNQLFPVNRSANRAR